MSEKKVFAYVGTWPVLLRGPAPGLGGPMPPPIAAPADVVETGIFGFEVDPASGDWTPAFAFHTPALTSELCLSRDGRFLYANDEDRNRKGVPLAGGGILAFSIDPSSGELTLLNEQPSVGTSPTCVDTDATGRFAFLSNLGNPHQKFAKAVRDADGAFALTVEEEEGSVSMFRILDDGSLSAAIDMAGSRSIDPEASPAAFSHQHCVKVDPTNRFLLSCDMSGKIWVFRIDHHNGRLIPAKRPFFETRPGVGPRTLCFHPNGAWFFVNNQANSTVYSFAFDPEDGAITELDYASAVFNEADAMKAWTSDMAISPDGKFLYVSNRSLRKLMPDAGCPPDTIAVFAIDQQSGKLELAVVTPVEAHHPKGLAFAPGGHFLYVAGMDANAVYRYAADPETGALGSPVVVAKLPVPSSISFLTVG